MTGDCATAGRLTDELLASDDAAERAAAVRIAASIAVHDGGAAQAADLFGWLGPYPDAYISAANAVVSIAAGDAQAARAALSTESAGPPTSTARAARNLAEGLLLSLDQPFPVAIARLGQAITTEQQQPGVAPDSAAALVTLAALHGGDPVRARSVIGRAVRAGGEDDAFSSHRHRLLLGWVRMQDGQLAAAIADAAAVGESTLHRRDALWAAALNTAIARRSGDGGAVQKHWYAAIEVLAEYSVDLFSLLPLGELWVAAARMRQVDRLQHTLDEALALLDVVGKPGAVVGAAALGGRARRNSGQLPGGGRPARPCADLRGGQQPVRQGALRCGPDMAAGAGQPRRCRRGDRRGTVAVSSSGSPRMPPGWPARPRCRPPTGGCRARCCSWPAISSWRLAVDGRFRVGAVDGRATGSPRPQSSRLSDREREVAELLLLGMPYRDIGSQLFISAKTVEHHVARIRRRLGAESRSEMLSMLRAMLATPS